ncbi:hydroxymethylglutaryl-CoA lyase [soil metagenome]
MISPLELGLPARYPQPGLPQRVRVYEVGVRDGLQAEKEVVSTDDKATFIEMLRATGLSPIEATSFVSPTWVPQLADAEELLSRLGADLSGYPVLVPNARGLARAISAGASTIAVFVSATETFANRNLNTTRRGALDTATELATEAVTAGLKVRGYVSMCFGDPWEGAVPLSAVVDATRELLDAGCYEVSLGDTIGVATPGHVRALLAALTAAGVPSESIALHFHDTYGQALANVHAGLQAGVTCFDASAGGIGGCPFAGSATGNLATEDLLWMLAGLGIETGVDLPAVVAAGAWMTSVLGKPAQSRVGAALG